MTEKTAFLVVGGDSLVGGGVLATLARHGRAAYGTTRRRDTVGPSRVFLDFEQPDSFVAPSDAGVALVIAAATNYDRCATDPMARTVNVELIPRSIGRLLEQGLHVTFISTNSVFGGERPWPGEDDPHAPGIPYAAQKSEGEDAVRDIAARLGAKGRLNIVRLTKIMNAGVSPLPTWFETWKRGEAVEPFADLVFAPISVRFVSEALVTIADARLSGNLHLSGAENVSYPDFAAVLANRLGVDDALIRPTTATARGVHIAFKPRFSGLGMARTTALTGIAPQPLGALVDDLVADLRQREAG